MSLPLVSIIVPVYNVEKYLGRCLDSVLAQDYSDIEVILVDDGSLDKSAGICDQYAEKDKRIRVIHQNNSGVSVARNIGITAANGKYLCFCDGDDLMKPFYVSSLTSAIETNGTDFAVAAYYIRGFCKASETLVPCKTLFFSAEEPLDKSEISRFSRSYMYAPWGKMYKADIIKKNEVFFPAGMGYGEDRFFVYRYLRYANGVSFIDRSIYIYNISLSSASQKYWEEMAVYCKRLFDEYIHMIDEKFAFGETDRIELLGDYAVKLFKLSCKNYSKNRNRSDAIRKIDLSYQMLCSYIEPYIKELTDEEYIAIKKKDWGVLYDSKKESVWKRRVYTAMQKLYKNIWSALYQKGLF